MSYMYKTRVAGELDSGPVRYVPAMDGLPSPLAAIARAGYAALTNAFGHEYRGGLLLAAHDALRPGTGGAHTFALEKLLQERRQQKHHDELMAGATAIAAVAGIVRYLRALTTTDAGQTARRQILADGSFTLERRDVAGLRDAAPLLHMSDIGLLYAEWESGASGQTNASTVRFSAADGRHHTHFANVEAEESGTGATLIIAGGVSGTHGVLHPPHMDVLDQPAAFGAVLTNLAYR